MANVDKDVPSADLFPLHYDWRDYGRFNATQDEQLVQRKRHCRCIKFYIFLTDIQLEQGAIRYIPYSQQFVRYLWANNTAALQKIHDRETNWNQLRYLLTVVTKDIEAGYPNKELLMKLRAIAVDLDQSYDFSISGKSGDVLVFDENGIHGGGPIRSGHRSICRIHYVDRDFVNDRLPDQQTGIVRHFLWWLRPRIKSFGTFSR